jgi:hypothetical protein
MHQRIREELHHILSDPGATFADKHEARLLLMEGFKQERQADPRYRDFRRNFEVSKRHWPALQPPAAQVWIPAKQMVEVKVEHRAAPEPEPKTAAPSAWPLRGAGPAPGHGAPLLPAHVSSAPAGREGIHDEEAEE